MAHYSSSEAGWFSARTVGSMQECRKWHFGWNWVLYRYWTCWKYIHKHTIQALHEVPTQTNDNFRAKIRCQKTRKKQRNFEHKMVSPAKWPNCTYDTLALSRRYTFLSPMQLASVCMWIWFADSIPALVGFLRALRFPPTPKNRTPSHKILFCFSGSSLWGCVCGCLMSAAVATQQRLEYPIG